MRKGFTFRKHKREGMYRCFQKNSSDIKLDGRVVGTLNEEETYQVWSASLALEQEPSEGDPAPFRWVKLKKRFGSEKEARDFILAHSKELKKFKLHSFDESLG